MNTDNQTPVKGPVPFSGAGAFAHPFRLGRRYSRGRNQYYLQVYRRGAPQHGRLMTLVYLKAKTQRVGFSVSAKVGGAVVRNRVRRRMKEDFRLLRPQLLPGKYVFIARPAAASAPYQAMAAEMRRLARKAGLVASPEEKEN